MRRRSYAPYDRFVGLKLPGEGGRSTLQVDQEHTVELATVTAQGAAAPSRKLSVKLYKVEWRWWWDRGEDSLAAYIARENSTRVMEADVTTNAQGRAQWKFKLGEQQWGRYLLRVCDAGGGHCTGSVFYVDWPYWSGEGREQEGPAATMLNLTADKASYQVGETATIQLPESAQGRALVTVETGSGGARRALGHAHRAERAHHHSGDGRDVAQCLCGGDADPAACGQEERPADPSVWRDSAGGGGSGHQPASRCCRPPMNGGPRRKLRSRSARPRARR